MTVQEIKIRNAVEAFKQIGILASELKLKIPKTSSKIQEKLGDILMISVAELGLLMDEI